MSTQQHSGFSLTVKEKLAIITFTRPKKKNAFNRDVYTGLTKVLNEISSRDDITITALTGQGDFYSSGNDLSDVMTRAGTATDPQAEVKASVQVVMALVAAFIDHKKVLVAFVNGPAIGIATTTLPLCDIVYCTPNAWFSTPFTQLGICAEGASSYTFPLILGTSKANDMLLFNGKMTAEEALSRGFVSKIIPPDQVVAAWKVLHDNATNLSARSLATSKALMRRWNADKLHSANKHECDQLAELFFSDEAREAIIRFATRPSRN